jgi:predicted metal-dependent enzyme (double-stranded beta helix superfamily)
VQTTVSATERLITRLDADTAAKDSDTICQAVKQTLIEEIGGGTFELPTEFVRPCDGSYARRLLHKTDQYVVVIMVWGVGQGTPIHDHDGNWCVECVYDGTIRVRSFDLVGSPDDEVVSFRRALEVSAQKGQAGSLIPPFDYHIIENAADKPAVTVHVYGGEMHGCHAYTELDDGRYKRERRALTYTPSVK